MTPNLAAPRPIVLITSAMGDSDCCPIRWKLNEPESITVLCIMCIIYNMY